MAINERNFLNERDFYASHEISFDAEEIQQIEYTKQVIKQAKIEVLTELLSEIEKMQSREDWCDYATDNCIDRYGVDAIIQLKINDLKGEQNDESI